MQEVQSWQWHGDDDWWWWLMMMMIDDDEDDRFWFKLVPKDSSVWISNPTANSHFKSAGLKSQSFLKSWRHWNCDIWQVTPRGKSRSHFCSCQASVRRPQVYLYKCPIYRTVMIMVMVCDFCDYDYVFFCKISFVKFLRKRCSIYLQRMTIYQQWLILYLIL